MKRAPPPCGEGHAPSHAEDISIRPYAPPDVTACVGIFDRAWHAGHPYAPRPIDETVLATETADETLFVAVDERDDVVGFVSHLPAAELRASPLHRSVAKRPRHRHRTACPCRGGGGRVRDAEMPDRQCARACASTVVSAGWRSWQALASSAPGWRCAAQYLEESALRLSPSSAMAASPLSLKGFLPCPSKPGSPSPPPPPSSLLIPGPTVLLVVSYALGQGWRTALPMAVGVALGDFTAMTLSMLGVGALLAASATIFTVLKWIGAAYLVWLGDKALARRRRAQRRAAHDRRLEPQRCSATPGWSPRSTRRASPSSSPSCRSSWTRTRISLTQMVIFEATFLVARLRQRLRLRARRLAGAEFREESARDRRRQQGRRLMPDRRRHRGGDCSRVAIVVAASRGRARSLTRGNGRFA